MRESCVLCFPKLQLSVEVEVVFSRGTLSPEQQKKVPLSQAKEQEHQVDGERKIVPGSSIWRIVSKRPLEMFIPCFPSML